MLAGATGALLEVMDAAAAGFSFVQTRLRDAPASRPAGVQLVMSGMERQAQLEQARAVGADFVSGPGVQSRPGIASATAESPAPTKAIA
jgi:hypothetical protein